MYTIPAVAPLGKVRASIAVLGLHGPPKPLYRAVTPFERPAKPLLAPGGLAAEDDLERLKPPSEGPGLGPASLGANPEIDRKPVNNDRGGNVVPLAGELVAATTRAAGSPSGAAGTDLTDGKRWREHGLTERRIGVCAGVYAL
jgi:hypothetical protein